MKIFSQNKPIVYKLWSITQNSEVYFYNGTSWSSVYTAPNPVGANWGCCWRASTENDFWCSFGILDYHDSYIYHYNGSTWTSQLIPGATVYGFWGTSSNDLWALAMSDATHSQYWHFDGVSWTNEYNYPTGPQYGSMTFICGSATNKIWCGRGFDLGMRWQFGYNGSFIAFNTTGVPPDYSLSFTRSVKFNTYDNKFYLWAGNWNNYKMYVWSHSNDIDGVPWDIEHNLGDSVGELNGKRNNCLHVYRDKIWACQNTLATPTPIWYYNGSSWSDISSGSGSLTEPWFLEGHQENIWIGGKLNNVNAFVAHYSSAGVWNIWDLGISSYMMDIAVIPT